MVQYQRGQKIELTLEKMAPNGVAFGRLPDGRAVFIKGAAPGETAEVRLTRIKKDFAEGELLRTIAPSPARVEPPFAAAALAGANWAYLDYQTQLEAKQATVGELLERFAHVTQPIQPIVPALARWRYRNKIELTFGKDSQGLVALGFHAPGRFDQIIPTDDVALFSEVAQKIIQAVVAWANMYHVPAYEPRGKTGLLRNLVIRRAEHGGGLLINLVTTPTPALPAAGELVHALDSVSPTGIVWTENASAATIVRADAAHVLQGLPFIDEQFLGKTIRYRADSFFQTNTTMAEQLAGKVLDRLAETNATTLIDGYAGVGGFGLFAAANGVEVTSIESHSESSADAQANAKRFGVAGKMKFINEPMEHYLASGFSSLEIRNSSLIVDPPRSGLHPKALAAIAQASVERIFYISCGPATLARDLATLGATYEVGLIQPFDLFPQTSHVETFVELVAKR